MTLTLPRGSALALVGPNGAGKTTLLKLVATLLRPTAGEGSVLGLALDEGADEIRRRTALLTVRGYLYEDLSAAENLRFSARMCGHAVDPARLGAILERVGLEAVADRRLRTFSTGMRKRLALAQLLIRSVSLALLDEPYSGLDAQGIALVDEVVREFRARGATVILASHQDGEAVRAAERAAILRRGELAFLEGPAEATRYLAGAPGVGAPAAGG